jgi:hypothetical protein
MPANGRKSRLFEMRRNDIGAELLIATISALNC